MTVKTTTHLNFRGQARAALAFYQSVFGGTLTSVSYAEAGHVQDPADAQSLVWGQVAAEEGFHVMAYDVPSAASYHPGEKPFFVSVRADDAGQLTRYWEKLCEGSTVLQPLGPSGFSPLYGMVKDGFGVTWVMDLQAEHAPA